MEVTKIPNRAELEKAAVLDYNERLVAMIHDFASAYPDVATFHYDVHSLFNKVIGDPAQFELTERYQDVTTVCPAYEKVSIPDFSHKFCSNIIILIKVYKT